MASLHVNGVSQNGKQEQDTCKQENHVINHKSRTHCHGLPFSPPMSAAAFNDCVLSREPQVVDRPSTLA